MHISLWQNILSDLSLSVDSATFETWFRPLQPKDIREGKALVVLAPNQYTVDFLDQNYKTSILALAKKHSPPIEDVIFFRIFKYPAVFR
jgi:chromosomal replication initiation ATPase DnaA